MIWTALQEWWCILPHWLCNETKSLPTSPPFPSLISCLLPSIRPPLSPHLLFATCTGTESPVSLRDTSICSTVDIYGQARSLSFIWFFFSRSCFRPSPSSARVSQWLMTPQVRLKRLKVWHLSTGPAAWMLTSMWCDTHRHMCVHLWAVMQFLEKEEKNPKKTKHTVKCMTRVFPPVGSTTRFIHLLWLALHSDVPPFFLALIGLRIDVFLQFTWHNYHQLDFFDLLVYFLMQCKIFHLSTEPPHNFLFIFSFVFHLWKGRRLCRLWQKLQVQGN